AFEPVSHRRERSIGLLQCRDARGLQGVELATPAAALRCRLADPGFEQAFAFETIERGVDRVDRDVAAGSRMDLLPNRGAVRRLIAEPQHAEQDELLEIAEHRRLKPHCGGY